jgi:hypothetical protein
LRIRIRLTVRIGGEVVRNLGHNEYLKRAIYLKKSHSRSQAQSLAGKKELNAR